MYRFKVMIIWNLWEKTHQLLLLYYSKFHATEFKVVVDADTEFCATLMLLNRGLLSFNLLVSSLLVTDLPFYGLLISIYCLWTTEIIPTGFDYWIRGCWFQTCYWNERNSTKFVFGLSYCFFSNCMCLSIIPVVYMKLYIF